MKEICFSYMWAFCERMQSSLKRKTLRLKSFVQSSRTIRAGQEFFFWLFRLFFSCENIGFDVFFFPPGGWDHKVSSDTTVDGWRNLN